MDVLLSTLDYTVRSCLHKKERKTERKGEKEEKEKKRRHQNKPEGGKEATMLWKEEDVWGGDVCFYERILYCNVCFPEFTELDYG